MKIGRNQLCPCGSGKKYKNCCMGKENIEEEFEIGKKKNSWEEFLNTEEGLETMYNMLANMRDFLLKDKPHIKEYKKIRKLHSEIIDSMQQYYEEGKFKQEFSLEKVEEKIDRKNIKLLSTDFDTSTQLGMTSLLNIIVYKNSSTANCLTEEYLRKNKFRKPEKVEFLRAMLNSEAGLFEITMTYEENGQVKMKNVLSGKEYLVTDIALSGNKNNDKFYWYNRIITYNGISFGTGIGIIFEKTDKFIINWIKENKKNYNEKEEMLRFLTLYNEYQKNDRGIKLRVNNM